MPDPHDQPEDLSFESAMESLDAIVASLEGERLPLEDMVTSYERGMTLLRVCRSRIENARQRIELITADFEGRGKASLTDFAAVAAPDAPSMTDESPKRTRKKPAAAEPSLPTSADDGGDIHLF